MEAEVEAEGYFSDINLGDLDVSLQEAETESTCFRPLRYGYGYRDVEYCNVFFLTNDISKIRFRCCDRFYFRTIFLHRTCEGYLALHIYISI